MYKLDNLPEKLKNLRLYKGFKKQTRAAEALGMARNHYNFYETGKKEPGIDTILKICNFFQTDINYFLSEGKPEDFDLKPEGRKRVYNIPFIETSVSENLFPLFLTALKEKTRFLINVKPLSGITITIKEFINQNENCICIDALENLAKPVKTSTQLFIIDHCHYPEKKVIRIFLDDLKRFNAGIVVITKSPLKLKLFDNIFNLPALNLDDIEKIVMNSLTFLKDLEKNDSFMKQKILMAITSEVFHNLGKLKNLESIISNKLLHNFSIYNLLLKLYNKKC